MAADMLLSATEAWRDVQPLHPPPESRTAVDIQYTAEYEDTFGLLYAVMAAGEQSERALALTERCIMLCSGHYTAWDYRFQCLEALESDFKSEWELSWLVAETNSKNYQLWNHRRRCAMRLGARNAPRELEFAAYFLNKDAKNYHIWAHRQAVVAEFRLWDQELEYAENCIAADVRNNSAWNQRAWLLRHTLDSRLAATSQIGADGRPQAPVEGLPMTQTIMDEAAYAAAQIEVAPHNESAWNYLVGLANMVDAAVAHSGISVTQTTTQEKPVGGAGTVGRGGAGALRRDLAAAAGTANRAVFETALRTAAAMPECVPANVALLRAYARAADVAAARGEAGGRDKARAAAHKLCARLAEMDPLRAPWYRHMQRLCSTA